MTGGEDRLARWRANGVVALAKGIAYRAARGARAAWWRLRDARFPTHPSGGAMAGGLARQFAPPALDDLLACAEQIRALSALCLGHRFDLLGSGWVEVRYGMACAGRHGIRFEPEAPVVADPAGAWLERCVNVANLPESRRLWQMVSPGYVPIDWQIDFRSGFRWDARQPAAMQRFGETLGADVKLPWALARMQHLPVLAHAFRLACEGIPGFEAPERYAREFSDQILDFMASNSPRFGINWASPMDVALRAAGWAVAHDLLASAGARLPASFDQAFSSSLLAHGRHVRQTLERHPVYRGNHYLCEIAGLLVLSSYLPESDEGRRWRDACAPELMRETARQFFPDGGNFEASTGYHRLSGEAVIYATALCGARFAPGHYERLARIAGFVRGTARPEGCAPQIGDHDSGRFLKIVPTHVMTANGIPEEDFLDHRHVAIAADALLGAGESDALCAKHKLERDLLSAFRLAMPPPAPPRETVRVGTAPERDRRISSLRSMPPAQRARFEFAFGAEPRETLGFPDFGLFVFRSAVSYACIRCGPIGGSGLGAHAHNDALALELVCEGKDVARDPGSFTYTSSREERDRYRSVRAHFAPRVAAREPATLTMGIFRLGDEARARCLYFDRDGFLGMHVGYGAPVYRHVFFEWDVLVVEDFSAGTPLEPLGEIGVRKPFAPVPFSPKYGVRDT